MARNTRYSLLPEFYIHRETERAYEVEVDMPAAFDRRIIWLPKSQVRFVDQGDYAGPAFAGRLVLAVANWLFAEKNIEKARGSAATQIPFKTADEVVIANGLPQLPAADGQIELMKDSVCVRHFLRATPVKQEEPAAEAAPVAEPAEEPCKQGEAGFYPDPETPERCLGCGRTEDRHPEPISAEGPFTAQDAISDETPYLEVTELEGRHQLMAHADGSPCLDGCDRDDCYASWLDDVIQGDMEDEAAAYVTVGDFRQAYEQLGRGQSGRDVRRRLCDWAATRRFEEHAEGIEAARSERMAYGEES